MTRLLFSAFALVALAHCATTQIKPGPGAQVVPPGVATASANGVRIWVDGDAWKGRPSDLTDVLTPIYVVIENRSGHPLRVANANFQLVGASRFRYSALTFISNANTAPPPNTPAPSAPPPNTPPPNTPPPNTPPPSTPPPTSTPPPPPDSPPPPPSNPSGAPSQPPANPQNAAPSGPGTPGISSALWESAPAPPISSALWEYHEPAVAVSARFGHRYHPAFHSRVGVGLGFYWGPHWWYPYPYPYPYWGYPYPYYYYSTPVPSQDMITQALPEGIVENGGRVSGFLYFQRVVGRETNLRFEGRFPDGKTSDTVATVGVPLVVTR